MPLIILVAVLLEPTHAARTEEPGACAHAWPGLRAAWAQGFCGRYVLGGKEDLHVDASAVVGEGGQFPPTSGGANEQLVRGGDWIVDWIAVNTSATTRVPALVARGGHDQHLRFVKCGVSKRPPTAHSQLFWALLLAA